MAPSGSCYIGMDPFRIESETEERVHLAHELGHCMTGSFYNVYSRLDIRERHEVRADRKAAAWLVPLDELKAAFDCGITEIWNLAEHFCVTEDFMQKTIDGYRVRGLLTAD